MDCKLCGAEMIEKGIVEDTQIPDDVLYFIKYECPVCGEVSYIQTKHKE